MFLVMCMELVDFCPKCIKRRIMRNLPLKKTELPDKPWSLIASDLFDTSLKTPEVQGFHFRFICPIHPYSAATIQAASYDETIVIQALGTLFLYTMHSN